MSTAVPTLPPPTRPARGRRRALVWAGTVVVLLGLVGPQAWAWFHLRAGRARLDRFHPEEARPALDAALRIWPNRVEARLLASRAARQTGDFAAAELHLRAAQRAAGGSTDEIAFEWALMQAALGNVWEVDQFLQERAQADPALTPLALEALIEGYLRVHRTIDAMATVDHWLQRDPDNVRALELRGATLVAGKGIQRGAETYRRVLELDPTRKDTRWRLILCLLDLGGYEEALPLLEQVARDRPDDPEVAARLARCQSMLGRGDEARRLLDDVLARHPDQMVALRVRGQFALADRDAAGAEVFLRRAAAADPNDYPSQWLLFQALQQQGRAAEAQEQLRIAEEVKDRSERLSELRSRKLAEKPLDPALHCEMGILMLRSGRPDLGEWWLHSALGLDPKFGPAHAALADLYEQAGNQARAAEHRSKVKK